MVEWGEKGNSIQCTAHSLVSMPCYVDRQLVLCSRALKWSGPDGFPRPGHGPGRAIPNQRTSSSLQVS